MLLIIGVLQLALAGYVRNTLIDAATEGARFGALADTQPADGIRRTQELITLALGAQYADSVRVGFDGDLVRIDVDARLPLLGFLGPAHVLKVSGHAAREPEL